MSAVTSKVLYFIAGIVPTAVEASEIAQLQTVFRNVQVRNATTLADTKYGANFESFDFLAGPAVPSAYSSIDGAVVINPPAGNNPDQFKLFPAAVSIDASNADVQQLAAVKAVIDPATGLAAMTDLAADATVTYLSSDTNVATVSSTGLVTAVAAGSATITATLRSTAQITAGAIEADDNIYTKAAHGLVTGDEVTLVSLSGGTGVTAGSHYFFHRLDADTGYLCASYADAVAGTAVNVTVDGTSVVLVKRGVTSTCAVTVAA